MEFQFGTMLFQLVMFLVLFLFLKRVAFGPLMKTMNERQQYIENQIAAAERNRQEAEELVKKHRDELEAVKREAADLMDNARRIGEKQAVDIIEAAEAEAKRVKDQAVADINREKELALAELRDQVGQLSVMLAGKVIAKELDAAKHKDLFDEAVKEMGEQVC